ncbi:hypothetical protein PTKIN_Ptkin14bG0113900 [Pterospermum kingtungense]
MSSLEVLNASGPLHLLQLWAFKRIPSIALRIPNTLKPGEPRAARFHRLKAKISLSLVRSVVRLPDNFIWRPYVADLENWGHPSYCKEIEFLSFDSSNTDEELKVAMQFGYDQDLPAAFPVSSISNARFAVVTRSFQLCVSVRYFNWCARSNCARKSALRDMKSSPSSVLAKRNMGKCPHSNEYGSNKPKTLETKVSRKAKTRTCKSKDCTDELDSQVCSLPTATISSQKIINSKDSAAMCSLKGTNIVLYQISSDNDSVDSYASGASVPIVKRQTNEECSDSPTSRVPNGNVRKRKRDLSSIVDRRSKPTTLRFDGSAQIQMNAGGSEGFPKNTGNATFKDTFLGFISNIWTRFRRKLRT